MEEMTEALNMIYPLNDTAELEAIKQWCVAKNLDPLNKPCYVRYEKGKPQIVPTLNGYVALCHQSGMLGGIAEPKYGPDDKSCTVTVTRHTPVPVISGGGTNYSDYTASPVYFDDYVQSDDHRKYPRLFLANWALAKSLKLAFADIIGGLPTDVELDSAIRFESGHNKHVQSTTVRPECNISTKISDSSTVVSATNNGHDTAMDLDDLLNSIDSINLPKMVKMVNPDVSEEMLQVLDDDMEKLLNAAQVKPVNVVAQGKSCDLDLHQRINIDDSAIDAQIADLFND
jgi:hypothetical protein